MDTVERIQVGDDEFVDFDHFMEGQPDLHLVDKLPLVGPYTVLVMTGDGSTETMEVIRCFVVAVNMEAFKAQSLTIRRSSRSAKSETIRWSDVYADYQKR